MDRLGDAQLSPVGTLIKVVFDQTAWDNPAMANLGLGVHKRVCRMVQAFGPANGPSRFRSTSTCQSNRLPSRWGRSATEFAGFGRLVIPRDKGRSVARHLSQAIVQGANPAESAQESGDPGPGSLKLMQGNHRWQRLRNGRNPALCRRADVDRFCPTTSARSSAPTSGPAIVAVVCCNHQAGFRGIEQDLGGPGLRAIQPQAGDQIPVYCPVEYQAAPAEIAQMFGPEGAISKYVEMAMGALVVRGQPSRHRTWGDLGVPATGVHDRLRPLGFAIGGRSGSRCVGWEPVVADRRKTAFMLRPQASPGTTGYVIPRSTGRTELSQWVWRSGRTCRPMHPGALGPRSPLPPSRERLSTW